MNQRYKRFPPPTSFSLLDLRSFSQDGNTSDDDYFLDEELTSKAVKFDEDHGVPIHKSNSFYTLNCLGRKAQLRKPLVNKLSKKDALSRRRALSKSQSRGWNAFDLSSDDSEQDTDEDDFSDTDSEESFTLDAVTTLSNIQDLDHLKPEDLQDAIKSFFVEHPDIQPPQM